MNALILFLFLLNNILWMLFYYLTAPESTKTVIQGRIPEIKLPELPETKKPDEEKKKPHTLVDVTQTGLKPKDVIKAMQGKQVTEGADNGNS